MFFFEKKNQKTFQEILLTKAAQIVPRTEQDDFLCILTGAKKISNLLMQIMAICFACGYKECSKLQFFEVPVTHREKRYVLIFNTICAKFVCKARQKVFAPLFSKSGNSQVIYLINKSKFEASSK